MAVLRIIQGPRRAGTMEAHKNNLLYEVLGRTYEVEYTVYMESASEGPATIFSSNLTPKIGETYAFGKRPEFPNEVDFVATLVRIQPEATANPKIWKLHCFYDTDRLISQVTDNPLNQPPEISWETEPEERPVTYDVWNTQYISSAGNAYDPPVTSRTNRSVLRILRNEATFNQQVANQWINKINVTTFAGYGRGIARINSITGRSAVSNGVPHYQVMYEIAFNPLTWYDYILDQDWRDCEGQIFVDKRNGAPLANQTLLNGRGMSLLDVKSGLSIGIDNAAVSLTLVDWRHVLRFPPPVSRTTQNVGGIVFTDLLVGPHNFFYILLENKNASNFTEIIKNPDAYYAGLTPEQRQDFLNPVKQPQPIEICLVTDIVSDGVSTQFTITRGQMGTIARTWSSTTTRIRMLPYYRYYQPYPFARFSLLNLPIV